MSRRRLGALFYLATGALMVVLAFSADQETLRVLWSVGAVLMLALALMN
jgi:hypothetical protein